MVTVKVSEVTLNKGWSGRHEFIKALAEVAINHKEKYFPSPNHFYGVDTGPAISFINEVNKAIIASNRLTHSQQVFFKLGVGANRGAVHSQGRRLTSTSTLVPDTYYY